jgi:hypothetical protein
MDMTGLWAQILVALIGGVAGAVVTWSVSVRLWRGPVPSVSLAVLPPVTPTLDRWSRSLRGCELAVCRARRAVDSVSSAAARADLGLVIRRMDAEMPHIRALVELGRGFDESGRDGAVAAERVLRQLGDAQRCFAEVADQVQETVVDLVAIPDLDRVHAEVVRLRGRFPLQRPMSALLTEAQPLVEAG